MSSVMIVSLLGISLLAWPPAIEKGPKQKADTSLEPYAQQANEAIGTLQKGLVKALTRALEEGGPEKAVSVCREEAQKITAQLSEEMGVVVGRTSHLLRNPVNAPREWARPIVEESAGKTTSAVEPHVLDLGDKVGVLKPINTLGLCANCHGKVEEIDAEVKESLAEFYPTDRAVGFSVGDLRGWMWAEISKR